MKRGSKSLAIRDMQMKIMMRFHLTTFNKQYSRIHKINNDEDVGNWNPLALLVRTHIITSTMGKSMEIIHKIKNIISNGSVILLPTIYKKYNQPTHNGLFSHRNGVMC